MRKQANREKQESLFEIHLTICKTCNASIKHFSYRLKQAHFTSMEECDDISNQLGLRDEPGRFPVIEMTTCKIFGTSIKKFSNHLEHVHKCTMAGYEELFEK